VNALSERLEVEVARGQTLYRQIFVRGAPISKLETIGRVQNRRGTRVRFRPDPQIFGEGVRFQPRRLFKMARSKAYLFGGVEIRWRCAPASSTGSTRCPPRRRSASRAGLKDYLAREIEGRSSWRSPVFAGKIVKTGGHGSLEWAVAWMANEDGFSSSYCNTIPTPEGGTHENGLRIALLRGLREHAERVGQQKRMAAVTTDDVMATCASMLSVFIREPEFQGQTKDKLATVEAGRIVENTVRDAFDHWLAMSPQQANKLLDWVIDRAEERLRRRQEKEVARKTATRKLRLPGKLADCTNAGAPGLRALHRRGRLGRRLAEAGARPLEPGRAAACAARSSTWPRPARTSCTEPAALRPRPRPSAAARARATARGPALRQGDHHDGRRRGRRPHRLAADHVLLPQMPRLIDDGHLYLAVPPLYSLTQGREDRLRPRRRPPGAAAQDRLQGQRQGRYRPLQGSRRDAAEPAQGNHHGPEKRTLLRVAVVADDRPGTTDAVERLMGNKPESRFAFIQERAAFADEGQLDI
jgi:topoisomerase-4 subunit B